jgi:hypothetical protein
MLKGLECSLPTRNVARTLVLLFLSLVVSCLASNSFAQVKGTIVAEDLVGETFRSGRIANRAGEYLTAVRRLNRVLTTQPSLIPAYVERGRAYKNLKKPDLAQADFSKAMSLAAIEDPILQEATFEYNVLELEKRLQDWKRRPFIRCAPALRNPSDLSSFPVFPSKTHKTPRECDDGDMTLFNGLLCSVGIDEGCKAVRESQSSVDGSWWRAPAKIDRPDPCLKQDECQTTFNSDQALGVYLYVEQTGDAEAFQRWLTWISKNPICNTISGACGWPGQARFCSNKGDCAMHAIDCTLVLALGEFYGARTRATQICGGALLPGLKTPAQVARWIDDAYRTMNELADGCNNLFKEVDGALKKLRVPVPPTLTCPEAVALRESFDKAHLAAFQRAVDVRAEVEGLLRVPGPAGATIAYESALRVATVNAAANQTSEARHLAGVELLVLKKINPVDPRIAGAALPLLLKSPKNPFNHYLTEGSRKPGMLAAILDKCPTTDFDPNNVGEREQWAWEREDSEDTKKATMYWDCIFAANLWKYDTQPISRPAPADPAGLAAFNRLHDAQSALRKQVDDLTSQASNQLTGVMRELRQLQTSVLVPNEIAGKADQARDDLEKQRQKLCEELKIPCPPGSIPTFPIPLPKP